MSKIESLTQNQGIKLEIDITEYATLDCDLPISCKRCEEGSLRYEG